MNSQREFVNVVNGDRNTLLPISKTDLGSFGEWRSGSGVVYLQALSEKKDESESYQKFHVDYFNLY